jgi:acyl carrier protein
MSSFYEGLAEILEIDPTQCSSDFVLTAGGADWDSLAIISTIALIDELYNCTVNGKALGDCITVGDIDCLIEAASVK